MGRCKRRELGKLKFLLLFIFCYVILLLSKQFLKFYVAKAIFKDSVKLLRKTQKQNSRRKTERNGGILLQKRRNVFDHRNKTLDFCYGQSARIR